MFGLEWNDVLEVSAQHGGRNILLAEVGVFLARRGLANFSGFSTQVLADLPTGAFYSPDYFRDTGLLDEVLQGSFYQQ